MVELRTLEPEFSDSSQVTQSPSAEFELEPLYLIFRPGLLSLTFWAFWFSENSSRLTNRKCLLTLLWSSGVRIWFYIIEKRWNTATLSHVHHVGFHCCCKKLPQAVWHKPHKFIIIQFCRLKSKTGLTELKTKVSAGLHNILEFLGENLSQCFFQPIRVCLQVLAHGPLLHFQCL